MRRLSAIFPVLLAVFCLTNLSGQVKFHGLDLNRQGILLFSAETQSPAYGSYSVLFSALLDNSSMSQLTYFPEDILLLGNGGLQIQNRFGVFRTDGGFQTISVLDSFPSFIRGQEIGVGKTPAMAASPDGKYLIFLRQETASEAPSGAPSGADSASRGYAALVLLDLVTGTETILSRELEFRYGPGNLLWSPDSQFFLYPKGEKIHYFSMRQFQEGRILPEAYRSLGSGGIENVRWTGDGELFYINKNLVYRILGAELFTQPLYENLLGIGTLVGKLPFHFDSNFDSFWVSPDKEKLLLNKGGQNIFVYYLRNSDFLSVGEIMDLPYLYLPRNTRVERVLWSAGDIISLLTKSIASGKEEYRIYRLNLANYRNSPAFTEINELGMRGAALSPEGTLIAVMMDNRVVIRDYRSWQYIQEFRHPEPHHLAWVDENRLIAAGNWYTELLELSQNRSTLICLSQAETYGFEAETGVVAVQTAGRSYSYDSPRGGWRSRTELSYLPAGVSTPRYRVYLDICPDRSYANQVMVRKVDELRTDPLFKLPENRYEPFPVQDEPWDPHYFHHGSRLRQREVALVFNGMDSGDGLTEVLMSLAEYGIKCTFFLNGDFIRQNPEAAREIADSGHEVGSLFYSGFNLTDSRYVVNRDFVKQGLARNEDIYFAATGRELSLLWHAPYYVVNTPILEASREMNYSYVGRDVDPLDWALADAATGRVSSMSVPAMVERIMNLKKPGSIIPIQLGLNDNRSSGYLYNNLDVLLNALLREGYSVVPVSVLIERAK